jgi:hypothetical protein
MKILSYFWRRAGAKSNFDDFLKSPMMFAQVYGGAPLHLPAHKKGSLPEIYFYFDGNQIAYIHSISLLLDKPIAVIGHFAVNLGLERNGIGRAVATSFFREINNLYGIDTLIFSERSTRYHEVYPPFFERLGAHPVSVQHQAIPDWHWHYSNLPIE